MTKITNIPKEELEAFDRLAKDAVALHVPITECRIKLEAFDQQGKLLQQYNTRSHSWTRNAYNFMFCNMAGKNAADPTFEAGKLSCKKTNAAIASSATKGFTGDGGSNYDLAQTAIGLLATAGTVTIGIVVGSNAAAESFEDYALGTLIVNGSGAGQLAYAQSEATVVSYVAGTKTLSATIVRYMNNNSGGDVTVNEVAIYKGDYISSGLQYCPSRDALAAPVVIPNYGQLKVTYVVSLVYPA